MFELLILAFAITGLVNALSSGSSVSSDARKNKSRKAYKPAFDPLSLSEFKRPSLPELDKRPSYMEREKEKRSELNLLSLSEFKRPSLPELDKRPSYMEREKKSAFDLSSLRKNMSDRESAWVGGVIKDRYVPRIPEDRGITRLERWAPPEGGSVAFYLKNRGIPVYKEMTSPEQAGHELGALGFYLKNRGLGVFKKL